MPLPPRFASAADSIRGSVFSALAGRIHQIDGEVYPFHVGDTWMEPLEAARMENLTVAAHPGMHRYAQPNGLPELLERLALRVQQRTGLDVGADNLCVTAGATGGLATVLGSIVDPGEEVLILAPYWPLIEGITQSFRARPVSVPMLDAREVDEVVEALERAHSERTVALYLSSPCNPTGRVLPRAWLRRLISWAGSRGLWVISDEVYEDYVYSGEHTPCLALDPERTVAAHSFSKAYGMAGNRCGYVVGPRELIARARNVGTHIFYSTPTSAQLAALEVLTDDGDRWLAHTRERYRQIGERTAELLGVPAPEGGTFLFLDVSDQLDERGLMGFLERCADNALFLAPGPSFGPYESHARLCFTAVSPDVTLRGAERLRQLLQGAERLAPST